MSEREYPEVCVIFTAQDVYDMAPDMSEEEAGDFLLRNAKYLQDRLSEVVNEALATYLRMDGHRIGVREVGDV